MSAVSGIATSDPIVPADHVALGPIAARAGLPGDGSSGIRGGRPPPAIGRREPGAWGQPCSSRGVPITSSSTSAFGLEPTHTGGSATSVVGPGTGEGRCEGKAEAAPHSCSLR